MKKETKIRLITAAVAVPSSVLCFVNFWSTVGLVAVAIGLAGYNYVNIVLDGSRKFHKFYYIVAIPLLAIVFGIFVKEPFVVVSLYLATMAGGFFFAILFKDSNETIEKNIVYGTIGLWYLSFNLSFFTVIYYKFDAIYSLALLGAVYSFDSAAYFVGSKWGRHKFVKRISSGKSIEGIVGGWLFTVVFFLIYDSILWPFFGWRHYSWISVLTISAVIAFFDSVGDLTQSVFKRNRQLKNAGKVLPGHGGFWDRIDGLVVTAPMYFISLELLKYFNILSMKG
ncbi:phosphatidate cytidylyltransferase [Mesoaciditoga sp.]